MNARPPTLAVSAAVGHGLLEGAQAPEIAGLAATLTMHLDAELMRLGIPRAARVEVRPTDTARGLRFGIGGRSLPYSPDVLTRAWRSVAPPSHWDAPIEDEHAGQRFPDHWLAAALEAMDAPERTDTLASLASAVMLEVIRQAPSCLLDDEAAEEYLMRARASKALRVAPGAAHAMRRLLDLGVSLADRREVLSTLSGGVQQGLDGDLLAEHAFPALRVGFVDILAHPEYLALLLGRPVDEPVSATDDTLDPGWLQAVAEADQWIFALVGQPLPRLRLVPAGHLEGAQVEVHVFGTPGVCVRGFLNPLELVVLTPLRLLPEGTEGRRGIDPSSGMEITVVPSDGLPPGVVGLDPARCVLTIAGREVFRRRERLLSTEDLHSSLASLAVYFPAIARAVSATMQPADVIQALRLVRAERHSLQDLRGIFAAMLDAFPTSGAHAAEAYADESITAVQELFLEPHSWEGELRVIRPEPTLEARLAEGHILSEAEENHLRDAVWSLLETVPDDGATPIFLTGAGARRPLLRLLAREFPVSTVLADHDVPLGRGVTVLGTISERKTPA